RKLHACETMGAATVICTDKTGTLTRNQMRIYKTDFPILSEKGLADDDGSALIREAIAVNSTAFLEHTPDKQLKVLGNPTEGALLLWLEAADTDYLALREKNEVIAQLPFSTERKYMATLVRSPFFKANVLYLKGAPEVIMKHCKQAQTPGGVIAMEKLAQETEAKLLGYQNQGMRTLGFAYKFIDDISDEAVGKLFAFGRLDASDLTFMGIAAISDPVREDVPQAIDETQKAGIQVKIVTGDTSATAKEIGRQIGLWNEKDNDRNHISGPDFAALDDEAAFQRVLDLKIMSRARPMDKERLVRLLQKHGQVVAVTGDGTNDAPALNAAQVGLSMGDGTTVAKEASAITILDNSFTSIGRAVMWGRSLYRNIQRFLFFQLIINVVACLVVFSGALIGTSSPLTVTQMLWVNLIMDTFAALALASLPPSMDVMKDAPRKSTDHILTKAMRKSILVMALFFIVILLSLQRYFMRYDLVSLNDFSFIEWWSSIFRNSGVSGEITIYEQSLFFTIFVMLQFWNLFNAKVFGSTHSAFYQMRESMSGFGLVLLLILIGQILIVSFGGTMFQVTPLRWTDWVWAILFTSPVLWLGEIYRAFERGFLSTKK
ncbi:MAG: cation-translocating P-type ATPase, partial [Bacteroidales bacterium]